MSDPFSGTEIAIVGMASRYPRSRTLDEFWDHLRNGDELISFLTDEELRARGVDGLHDDARLVQVELAPSEVDGPKCVLDLADRDSPRVSGSSAGECDIALPGASNVRKFRDPAFAADLNRGLALTTDKATC